MAWLLPCALLLALLLPLLLPLLEPTILIVAHGPRVMAALFMETPVLELSSVISPLPALFAFGMLVGRPPASRWAMTE